MDYGIVHKVPRVSALRAPLTSYEDLSGFKLFCIDTGILGALSGLTPAIVLNGPAVFTEFKGSLTEQYVAQELLLQGNTPRIGHPPPAMQRLTLPSTMRGPCFRSRSRRQRISKQRA